MNKTTKYCLLLIGGIVVLGFLYIVKKRFDGQQRFKIAADKVKSLTDSNRIKDGDIIFQTSLSRQSKAIALATHSKYSHCGVIFSFDTGISKYYVIEAEAKVKWTPLDKWIARGQSDHFVIKRIDLTPPMAQKLKIICEKYIGKGYDPYFEWSDDKIYCSELVWKAYYRLDDIRLGDLQLLKDFDLSSKLVINKLKERYGDKIPLNDTVISPGSIYNCRLLKTVVDEE